MAINISLPPRHEVDPHSQPIPRNFVGYDPKLSDEQLWNANRGAYELDDWVAGEQFATFSFDGTIRLVAELEGIENVEEDGQPRKALLGRILHAGDPVRDALVGTQAPAGEEQVAQVDTEALDQMPAQERYAETDRSRRAFLLLIDPAQWFWSPEDEAAVVARTGAGAPVREVWPAGGRRQGIEPGDRVFLLQKGSGARGIRGIGRVSSRIYQGEHWDDPKRTANYVDVDWDLVLSDAEMIELDHVVQAVPGYGWNPQKGGVELHQPMADQMEDLWAQHTGAEAHEPVKGAGWHLDDLRRRAVNAEARRRIHEQFELEGWEVVDTEHERPYCAVAYRDGESRFLCAKGAETVGRPVLLTAEEVAHAADHPGETLLGVLTDVEFTGGSLVPGSGVLQLTELDLQANPAEPVLLSYQPAIGDEQA